MEIAEIEPAGLDKIEHNPDIEVPLPGIPVQEQFIPEPGQIGEEDADLDESQV